MEPFTTHRGRIAVLEWSDVNTDLIIPARYLKKIERTGFGPLLFADKRYAPGGAPEADHPEKHGPDVPDFPLNNPAYQGATVLVVGANFGCGSSREHAVWAVMQGGYRAVVAPGKGVGFADIFESNAFQNGLLVIELDEDAWQKLVKAGRDNAGEAEVTVDLRDQTVQLHAGSNRTADSSSEIFHFEVPESHRQRLLRGLDAIAETLVHSAEITQHEASQPNWLTLKS
jgi:3-isopropylmalate/(R)-2-methylmalate dehydratase small subunit